MIIFQNGPLFDSTAHLVRERPLSSDLTIGVVSGVVTGVLIYLFNVVWQRVLVPWYEERQYSGIDISGEWQVTHPGRDETHEWTQAGALTITQSAHRLSGSVILLPTAAAPGEGRSFIVSGEISDRFVWLRLKHTNRNRLGTVVVLVEVVGDGRTMKGHQVHYDTLNNQLDTAPVSYVRRASVAGPAATAAS